MALMSLLIAILATYRLAQFLPQDDGPFFIFRRIRSYVTDKAMVENNLDGFWAMVDEAVNCPYCTGLYAAVFTGLLVALNNYYGNMFLLILAIAGGQSLLQSLREK